MELKKSLLTIENTENLHLCFELDDKIYGVSLENCKFCLFFAVDSDEIQSENLSENKQQNFLIRRG